MKKVTKPGRDRKIFRKTANRTNARNAVGFGDTRGMSKL